MPFIHRVGVCVCVCDCHKIFMHLCGRETFQFAANAVALPLKGLAKAFHLNVYDLHFVSDGMTSLRLAY